MEDEGVGEDEEGAGAWAEEAVVGGDCQGDGDGGPETAALEGRAGVWGAVEDHEDGDGGEEGDDEGIEDVGAIELEGNEEARAGGGAGEGGEEGEGSAFAVEEGRAGEAGEGGAGAEDGLALVGAEGKEGGDVEVEQCESPRAVRPVGTP